MPFADYVDFDDCVAQNQDKDDPKAYCGALKHKVEGAVSLPDVADVSFPSMVGAIDPHKPKKKGKRKGHYYKGVMLSRPPMKFEAKVLALTEIPVRLDMARDAVLVREDDALLRTTMEQIAQYGADEVMAELVRQGAPARTALTAPTINIEPVYTSLVADRAKALATLRGEYEYRLCRRRIKPERQAEMATSLSGLRRPALMKRFANRAINEAFAFGRSVAIAQVRRRKAPVEFELAYQDDQGRFISRANAVMHGHIGVDAVIQTAVMDTNTCDECSLVDGEVMELGSDRQEELHPPYVMCHGGDQCRCVQIAMLADGSEIEVDEIDEADFEDAE